ncbi:MAG: MFS transporter [Oscillospiraceae bacterium]
MKQIVVKEKKTSFALVMLVYLAGIFMGAIDTGIVTPARTIIQNDLGVSAQTGIWMITIYTLAYAASVPIMGKLADKFGRKYVYIASISLFGLGSLFCGLSQSFGGFTLLIVARAVQAIGGGGIVPIATAEFGTTFPKEKRGMALGLVGGVFGIANVFGASAGSAILDIFGKENWSYIFYINVPITLFIVICGLFTLKNNKSEDKSKIDIGGIFALTIMVLSLLYGLHNLDFFNFMNSFRTTSVYPFLLVFIVLIPIFILIEKKAADPVINLHYFTNKNILITLILSFVSGFVMMGVIFVPQFSENALKIATGSGGYLVIILGLFAGVGAPLSGKLIDKFGAKIILAFGFGFSIFGALFLAFVTTANPNIYTVLIGLMLSGLGMGFTMGTPVNYMMLANTDKKESNSSLATISLVRSIGTAIAPAIMVGFIANAGLSVQTNVMALMPKEIDVPKLPYANEITLELNNLKANPQMKDKLQGIEFPDLTSMEKVKINMGAGSSYKMPADLLELMRLSDVTTITANTKVLAQRMFKEMTPQVVSNIQGGVSKGISGIDSGTQEINRAMADMKKGYSGICQGIDGMKKAVAGQKEGLTQLEPVLGMISKMGITQLPPSTSFADLIPPPVKQNIPPATLKQLSGINSVEQLQGQIQGLKSNIGTLEGKIQSSEKSKAEMEVALKSMDQTLSEMTTLSSQMTALNGAVPGTFDKALENYIKVIGGKSGKIESTFQDTLNVGFKDIYLTTVVAGTIALIVLIFYKKKNEIESQ